MSSFSIIFDAIFKPGKAFQTLREKPYFLTILILGIMISAATSFVVMFNLDETATKADIRSQLEERRDKLESRMGEELTPEKMDQMVEMQWKSISIWGKVSPVFAPVMSIIVYLILALIFFLVFKLLDSETTLRQSFSMLLHAYIPHLLKAIIAMIISFAKGGYGIIEVQNLVASNPGFLVNPNEQKVMHGLLSSLDVFNIWVIVLTIMGFSVVSGKKTSTVTAWVIGLWVFYIGVFKVALPAILGSVFG